MERPTARLLPVLITASVVLVICFLEWALQFAPGLNLIERAELFTYDWRARFALHSPVPTPNRLTLIYIDDYSIEEMSRPPVKCEWPWSRDVYGRLIRELKAEGAKVIGIDGFLTEMQDRPPRAELGGLTPDAFLGQQLAAAGNVILPTTCTDVKARPVRLLPVAEIFETNAWAVGQDGVPGLSQLNTDRLRSITPFVHDRKTGKPVWQMAILMAALDLGLDLENALETANGLLIPRAKAAPLEIPLDHRGQVLIDWRITISRFPGMEQPFSRYYENALRRERGQTITDSLNDHLVVIGFTLSGDRADDWGPSPVDDHMPHCLAHINLLRALMAGEFIRQASGWTELLLIIAMAALSGILGWRLRWGWGVAAFCLIVVGYWWLAVTLFVRTHYWLPVAAPLFGAFMMGYVCLVTYRIALEKLAHRHVHSVLGKVVSPNIFNLLVRQPASALDTARREVTIYFADVRGFTRFMEENHTRVAKGLDTEHTANPATQAVISESVREPLETVNGYLGAIADEIKANDGTLDKYIGDCVMGFWGAPVADKAHAARAVSAAIAIQRNLHETNLKRTLENERRQHENMKRLAAGVRELELLPILRVGSALNSGTVTVGFMGSAVHVSNYTVFGREVNIASRLEGIAEPDCILVTEATYLAVKEHDPKLADTFLRRDPVLLHGISNPVQIYEVPWRTDHGKTDRNRSE